MAKVPYSALSEEQKARAKEAVRRYRAAHPERVQHMARKYRAKNPEAAKQARARNAEPYRAAEKKYREKNKERRQEEARKYVQKKGPEWRRARSLKHLYGLTVEEYERLLRAQGGVCAICKQPETRMDKRTGRPRRLSVDHNHMTQRVRGLLCNRCNRAVGLMGDNADRMAAGASYLAFYAQK